MNRSKRLRLVTIVIILTAISITFRLLNSYHFEQTSLLFVGIPTLLCITLIMSVKKPKSAYGVVFLVTTIFLLISGIFLGEGFVCILFMAPIFYLIVFFITWIYQLIKNRNKLNSVIAILFLIIMFQPNDYLQPKKVHKIETIASISKNNSIRNLSNNPNFLENLPVFFNIGFPKPLHTDCSGLKIGDTRTIDFKSSTKGIGSLVLEVKEVTDSKIVYAVKKDDTHISHWLSYKKITVELIPTIKDKKVKWTTEFTCDLGPTWYFEPFEKYAIGLVNKHLIASFFY